VLRFGLEVVDAAGNGERVVGDEVDAEGGGVGEAGDSGLEVGL
jgi:hypothetical protein